MRSKDDVSNRFSLVSPINNKFKRHKHNPTPSPEPFVSSPKDKKSSCDFSEEKGWQTVKSRSEKKFEKEKSFIHAFQLCIDSENDFDVGSDGIITCGNAGKVRVDKVVKFVMKKLIGKKLKGSYTFAVEFVESDPEFGIFDVAVSQRFHQFLIQSKFYENAPKPLIDDYWNWRCKMDVGSGPVRIDIAIAEHKGEKFCYDDINWKCEINFDR